jgi:ABC-2 type transport system permease protein
MVDRLRAMDVGGRAILAGHVAASVVRNAASTVLVLGVGVLVSFRPHAGALDWLAAAALLLAFVVALSWFAAVIGLLAKTPEGANGFTFFVMFLPYPSSAFVPIHTMPAWIQGFATHQPVTPVIETLRSLLLGTPAGANPWQAVAWCAGILAVSVALSALLFRRRTA